MNAFEQREYIPLPNLEGDKTGENTQGGKQRNSHSTFNKYKPEWHQEKTIAMVNAVVLYFAVTTASLCFCTKFKVQDKYQKEMTPKVSK